MFEQNCLYFNFCPFPLVFSLRSTRKGLAAALPPHQVFIRIDKITPEPWLLQAEQLQLATPLLI